MGDFGTLVLFSTRLLFLLSAVASTTMPYCNEFVSPQKRIIQGDSVGTIRFPLKGGDYSRDQLCEWIIESKDGQFIEVRVTWSSIQGVDVSGECNTDYVNIYDVRDGNTVFMDRFCGTQTRKTYTSTGNTMSIRFMSDGLLEYKGFGLSYKAVGPGSSGSHEKTVQLAVGIPVGILVTAMIVVFIFAMSRIYLKRRYNQAVYSGAAAATPPLASQAWNQQLTNTSVPPNSSATETSAARNRTTGRGPPVWASYRSQGYDPGMVQGFPLQVALPEDQDGFAHGDGGRSSPPPAYESLGYEYEEQAMTPPPYDAVVKEAENGPSSSA